MSEQFERTFPDWGRESGQFGGIGIDPLEAAVNRGAVNAFYRTGRVLYVDGFEEGLSPWRQELAQTGAIANATDFSFFGSRSVLLTPDNTPGSTDPVFIAKDIPYIRDGLYGVEFAFCWAADGVGTPGYFAFSFRVYDGTNENEFIIYFDHELGGNAPRIQLFDGAVFTTLVANLPGFVINHPGTLATRPRFFHIAKLVVDSSPSPPTFKYLRHNGNIYDLSSYGPQITANAQAPSLEARAIAFSETAQIGIYVDNAIVTIDELDRQFE